MEKVTIGLIGVGSILDSHLSALKANPEYKLVSVCRRSAEQLRHVADKLGVRGFADYHDLLSERPDVVLVSLPHGMHCKVTLEAFQAGCHVLVEKPMAVSVQECNQMLAGVSRYGKQLVVTESATFTPGALHTGIKFNKGILGRFLSGSIINARLYFTTDRPAWFLDPAMSGGGMFSNVGLHRLAIARSSLRGLKPATVYASVEHIPEYKIEACTSAIVKYKTGGAMLYEEIGYYSKPAWLNTGTHFVFEEGLVGWSGNIWRMMGRDGKQYEELLPPDAGYAPVYANMLKAIRADAYWPLACEYAEDTAIAQAAYASSSSGKEINLMSENWRIGEDPNDDSDYGETLKGQHR